MKKKILLVGGGSGGHILPVVWVAKQLLKDNPNLKLTFCSDNANFELSKTAFEGVPIEIKSIMAGKFRRYHHLKWYQHLAPNILLPNLIDIFKVIMSYIQAFILVIKIRPEVIFAKGGYPCLGFGMAARLTKTKLVIHDSDTVAGLTNKILSRHANKILTGMPTKYYNYNQSKTIFVGLPTRKIEKINPKMQKKIKKDLDLDPNKKMILMTGGGLGANFINDLALKLASEIGDCNILLLSGERDFKRVSGLNNHPNLHIIDFTNEFDKYLIISDLIISRAGATTIAEIIESQKPAILIPSNKLAGNHQVKNAKIMTKDKRILVVDEVNFDLDDFLLKINLILDQKLLNQRSSVDNKTNASVKISQILEKI